MIIINIAQTKTMKISMFVIHEAGPLEILRILQIIKLKNTTTRRTRLLDVIEMMICLIIILSLKHQEQHQLFIHFCMGSYEIKKMGDIQKCSIFSSNSEMLEISEKLIQIHKISEILDNSEILKIFQVLKIYRILLKGNI